MSEEPDINGNEEYLIAWKGKDDPENPMNWTLGYKSLVIAIVSFDTWVVYVRSHFINLTHGDPFID